MSAIRVVLALMAVLGLGATPSLAQTYPAKPARIIVPTSPGGITDTLARALAQRLTDFFGQTVIVENRPAGAGQIGMDFVAKSAPDGYTLMVNSDAAFVVNPHLYSKLPYDSIADFIPISGLGISPQALVLHPSVPANTLGELIAYAKTRPGALNYGTFGIGTSGHLNIIHLESETGTKFIPVHYRGAAPAITDLLGGHIQMMIVAIGLLRQNIEAGKLKAIAIGSRERLPQYPDLPTLSESGFPGFEQYTQGLGIVGPANLPAPVVNRLNEAIRASLVKPETKEKMSKLGAITEGGSTPAEFRTFLVKDLERWERVIKAAGVKAE